MARRVNKEYHKANRRKIVLLKKIYLSRTQLPEEEAAELNRLRECCRKMLDVIDPLPSSGYLVRRKLGGG